MTYVAFTAFKGSGQDIRVKKTHIEQVHVAPEFRLGKFKNNSSEFGFWMR